MASNYIVFSRNVLITASGVTAVFFIAQIEWIKAFSTGHGVEAASAFLGFMALALFPYLAAYRGITRLNWSMQTSIGATVVMVGTPLALFPYYLCRGEPTGGWDVILVVFWQIVALLLFHGIGKYWQGGLRR